MPTARSDWSSESRSTRTRSAYTPVIGVRDKGRRSASLRLLILHTLSDHPETLSAMLYSLALFRSVFPLPLWEEAHLRALSPQNAL